MPQSFGLGVMDSMQPFDPQRRKPAAGDKVDADGKDLAGGVEINDPHIPQSDDAEGSFKQLVLHPRALASIAECRTMPAFSKARLSGPVVAVKGSLRRASPALDRAHRTRLSSPTHSISKEAESQCSDFSSQISGSARARKDPFSVDPLYFEVKAAFFRCEGVIGECTCVP